MVGLVGIRFVPSQHIITCLITGSCVTYTGVAKVQTPFLLTELISYEGLQFTFVNNLDPTALLVLGVV